MHDAYSIYRHATEHGDGVYEPVDSSAVDTSGIRATLNDDSILLKLPDDFDELSKSIENAAMGDLSSIDHWLTYDLQHFKLIHSDDQKLILTPKGQSEMNSPVRRFTSTSSERHSLLEPWCKSVGWLKRLATRSLANFQHTIDHLSKLHPNVLVQDAAEKAANKYSRAQLCNLQAKIKGLKSEQLYNTDPEQVAELVDDLWITVHKAQSELVELADFVKGYESGHSAKFRTLATSATKQDLIKSAWANSAPDSAARKSLEALTEDRRGLLPSQLQTERSMAFTEYLKACKDPKTGEVTASDLVSPADYHSVEAAVEFIAKEYPDAGLESQPEEPESSRA